MYCAYRQSCMNILFLEHLKDGACLIKKIINGQTGLEFRKSNQDTKKIILTKFQLKLYKMRVFVSEYLVSTSSIQ